MNPFFSINEHKRDLNSDIHFHRINHIVLVKIDWELIYYGGCYLDAPKYETSLDCALQTEPPGGDLLLRKPLNSCPPCKLQECWSYLIVLLCHDDAILILFTTKIFSFFYFTPTKYTHFTIHKHRQHMEDTISQSHHHKSNKMLSKTYWTLVTNPTKLPSKQFVNKTWSPNRLNFFGKHWLYI